MKMRRFAALLLVLLLLVPCFAAAEASDALLDPGIDLTEAQQWWVRDLGSYAPYWDRFQVVELPDQTWFRVYELPGNVFALFEYRQSELVISYLILGEESALLWDTGLGIGDIRACVEELTDLPITVLNSHDHFDHIGGNAQFERVMCYHIESALETLKRGIPHEELVQYIDPEEIVNPSEGFSADTFFTAGKAPTATVEDGQVIDLGNRPMEVMYTPGHNESCITLIDEQNGLLFTGDLWYLGPLYAFDVNSSLSDYLESMRKIKAVIQEKKIRWVYGSHNAIFPDTDMVLETTAFLEDVISGKLDYTVKEGQRVYKQNELVSLCLPLE